MVFKNRTEAGRQLASKLSRYLNEDVVVCAVPRGGVVVGTEVAQYLEAPLEIITPRKISHPMLSEYAIGAVTETGSPVWEAAELGFTSEQWRQRQVQLARQEAKRRRRRYLDGRLPLDLTKKVVIVVDDGAATGLTMIAALKDLLKHKSAIIVVAVPVAPSSVVAKFRLYADDVVVLEEVAGFFGAIGSYYGDFAQVEDEEVRGLLDAYRDTAPAPEPLDLPGLNALLGAVSHYPVTNKALAAQAKRLHAPTSVVNFFESIPGRVEFKDRAEVMKRSQESEVIMEEEAEQPTETLHSYD